MMPCQQQPRLSQHSWTLSSLLSAFIQLLFIYLLLCCSAIAFFLSKFLSLFGISLHCPPCLCFFLDCPSHSLSFSSEFPFIRPNQLRFEWVSDHGHHRVDDSGLDLELTRRGFDRSKMRERPGFMLRRRLDLDSDNPFYSDVHTVRPSPLISYQDGQDTSLVPARTVQDFGADADDGDKLTYDNGRSFDIPRNKMEHGHGFDCHDQNAVKILEQALELEQSARAALCAELEQERIAAATAADETMAMISRLQEEKASVEIEARQYQRILEEKSAYDAEEMTILKEIIVRREREIHFLEKELEECRKRLQENEGLECQVEDTQEYYDIMESRVDPLFKQGNESAKSNRSDFSSESVKKQTSSASLNEKFPAPECRDKGKESPESLSIVNEGDEYGQEIQEKGILSADDMLFSQFSKSKNSMGHEFFEENSNPVTGLMSNDNVELGIDKSFSDMADRFSSLSRSPSTSVLSEQRQNSLSLVDLERLKIDGEIECLRARLRAVQKEKEKLKSPLESQERGKSELRLLEDIAVLLREIRHLREPEKVARQASLPPLSSKESSKRRRSKSTSVGGVGQSTMT